MSCSRGGVDPYLLDLRLVPFLQFTNLSCIMSGGKFATPPHDYPSLSLFNYLSSV